MTSLTCVIAAVPEQLSVAVTRAILGTGTRLAHCTVILVGQVIIGGVSSRTVMIWLQVAELPHKSVALYVRVSVYRLGHVWLEITSPTCVITAVPEQLSVDVTSAILGAGTKAAHCTLIAAGHVSIGGVSSNTVMICVQVDVFPQPSVAR